MPWIPFFFLNQEPLKRKFVFSVIKNQIVNFYGLKIRNVNVLVGNYSLFYPKII